MFMGWFELNLFTVCKCFIFYSMPIEERFVGRSVKLNGSYYYYFFHYLSPNEYSWPYSHSAIEKEKKNIHKTTVNHSLELMCDFFLFSLSRLRWFSVQ